MNPVVGLDVAKGEDLFSLLPTHYKEPFETLQSLVICRLL